MTLSGFYFIWYAWLKEYVLLLFNLMIRFKVWPIKLVYPVTFYWSTCTKRRKWTVMYVCGRDMDFYIFSRFFCLNLVLFQQSGMIYFPFYCNSQIQPKTDSIYGLWLLLWYFGILNFFWKTRVRFERNIGYQSSSLWLLYRKLYYICVLFIRIR